MSTQQTSTSELDQQVALLRLKKRMKEMDEAAGKGTSMISLFIPPGNAQLIRANKILGEEYGTSAHIKARV